jgi:Substrate binding domain of ABC-type glycine betaine transport system
MTPANPTMPKPSGAQDSRRAPSVGPGNLIWESPTETERSVALLVAEGDTNRERAVDGALRRALPSSLEVLAPSPAQDANALAVTPATASHYRLTTIASLKPVASRLVVSGSPEFATRAIGLPGLARRYGLHFKSGRGRVQATAAALGSAVN